MISIKIQVITSIKTKTIIFIRTKITLILSYNIHNKIKTFNQFQQIINPNLHLSYQDKITSFLKINDNWKNKNFKTPPLTNKTLSSPNNNPLKDPSKPSNKNQLSIKDNFKNLNYNNNLHSIKILSGDKIKIDHNKNPTQIKTISIINSIKT